jgi:hypothetical protein
MDPALDSSQANPIRESVKEAILAEMGELSYSEKSHIQQRLDRTYIEAELAKILATKSISPSRVYPTIGTWPN